MFDADVVNQGRRAADAHRLLVARLAGIANRHSRWRELTESETAAAVDELQEVAGGRGDLLAEVAGILLGAREGDLDEPKAKVAAELCRLAGADEPLIPAWIEEGKRRVETRRLPPFRKRPELEARGQIDH